MIISLSSAVNMVFMRVSFISRKKDLLVLQAKFLETKRKKILKKRNLKMKLKDVDDKIDFTENAQ